MVSIPGIKECDNDLERDWKLFLKRVTSYSVE